MADDNREVVAAEVKRSLSPTVALMVRWAVAAIPVLIVLLVVGAVASAVIVAIFGGAMPNGLNRWWLR
jgi:predicted transcriptional regulator